MMLALKIGLFLSLLIGVLGLNTIAQSDVELIQARINETLLAPSVQRSKVSQIIDTQNPDGSWPGINYQDTSRTGFEHRFHLANMMDLAHAYAKEASPFYQEQKLLQSLNLALKFWVDHDFLCANWWHNQIGSPSVMIHVMLLAGKDLEPQLVAKAQTVLRRAHINAPGARPGGDRIKIASIQAKNALFLGQEKAFAEIVEIIEGEIKFSDWVGARYGYGFRHTPGGFENREMGGRGIQYDYSFHHRADGVNNTLSYGMSYAAAFIEWAVYTRGTAFAFSPAQQERLIDYFLDGICKTAVYGKYPDAGAKNRSITRRGALKPYSATLAEQLLLVSSYRQADLEGIIAVINQGISPTLSHATYFWHSEHFAFQRPDWFASVRMYSTRNHNMEVPYNGEGFLNHHRGDGVNHLSLKGDEYVDIWPVYDYQKIPGTTVLQKPALTKAEEVQKLGKTDFVGAVTDGEYGAAAFDFQSPHDPLIARKAWFFFDEEYVCLGTGISSPNRERPVFTTLNQCHLRGPVTFLADGQRKELAPRQTINETLAWVYHDQVGYLFPQATAVSLSTQAQTGAWYRINQQTDSPKDSIELDVFSLWLDHGKRPSNATYAYTIVPRTNPEALAQKALHSPIQILNNTPEVQAVYHKELNMCQAVFYQAGEVKVTDSLYLKSETPGVVMLQALPEGKYRLSVSDPNRELGAMQLTLPMRIAQQVEGVRVFWEEEKRESTLMVELPEGQYAGSSRVLEW